MARLMLSLDGQILAEYNMNKERYTIGRLPDNDIRIDNPAVSGHHSLIINILNDSFLEDLNSTNGTYVNGKLIKKHAMQHGDVITVGHHQLRFIDSQDGEAEQDEFEKTMVITPSSQGEERIRRVGVAVDQAAKAVAKRPGVPDNVTALPKNRPENEAWPFLMRPTLTASVPAADAELASFGYDESVMALSRMMTATSSVAGFTDSPVAT